jgi:hypothetical protein
MWIEDGGSRVIPFYLLEKGVPLKVRWLYYIRLYIYIYIYMDSPLKTLGEGVAAQGNLKEP